MHGKVLIRKLLIPGIRVVWVAIAALLRSIHESFLLCFSFYSKYLPGMITASHDTAFKKYYPQGVFLHLLRYIRRGNKTVMLFQRTKHRMARQVVK